MSTTDFEKNIILNAWCLLVALTGTFLLDRIGRKPLAIISCIAMTIFIFLVGGLTKSRLQNGRTSMNWLLTILLLAYGDTVQKAGIYGTVAVIFLFQGSYSLAWTPLAMLYPPEVLNYSVRSVGMGFYTFLTNGLGYVSSLGSQLYQRTNQLTT
jgi:MFS family permease